MKREEVKHKADYATDRRGQLYHTIPFDGILHPSALKFVAQGLYLKVVNPILVDRIKAIKSLDTDMNRKKANNARLAFAGDSFGQGILNCFYNKNSIKLAWSFFINNCRVHTRGYSIAMSDVYLNFVVDLFHDAIGLGFKSLEHKYRTDTVMTLIKGIRKTGDFSRMPILADALQDADFDNEDILAHYRNPNANFSFGSWIFRASGFNCKVKDAKLAEQVVE